MRISNYNHARFLCWLFLSAATCVAMAIAFVVVVDPYGLYDLVKIPSVNSVKPGLTRYQEEIKLAHAIRARPTVVILGNSRAEIGFDPDAPAFGGARVYNLAIPGSGISTARRQLEHLHGADAFPRSILLSIEFVDFLAAPSTRSTSYSLVGESDQNNAASDAFWRFDTLFSLTSSKDAVRTLYFQESDEAPTMTRNGFNPFKEYRAVARNDGYYVMFRQRAQENTKTYLRKASGSLSMADVKHLQAILDLAAKSATDVNLIIYPYHAQILSLFEETGLWSAFEEWKSMLVAEVSAARQRHPASRIKLTDFSGFGSYQCERIPAKGDTSVTQWYWEAGHFKKELGDVVLLSLLAPPRPDKQSSGSSSESISLIGMSLEESDMAANRRRIANERGACLRAYPELFSETGDLVRKIRYR